ncbi:hypothetical protein, partial [Streptomyces sp. NPDC048188]|uniref:hypothetical protein n=1 Tax=Streptomyces sp. NPDC048188 TaxID=3155749 RepID=UPI003432F0F0
GGVELCVAELGDPRQPTIVLVHGYPDSKEVWSHCPAHPPAATLTGMTRTTARPYRKDVLHA